MAQNHFVVANETPLGLSKRRRITSRTSGQETLVEESDSETEVEDEATLRS